MSIETGTSAAPELGTRSSTTRGRRGRDTARAYTPYIANGARKVTTGFLFCGIGWADWGFSRENAVLVLAVRRVHAPRTGSPVTSGGGPGERGALAPWWTRDHRTPRGRSHGAIAQVGETGQTAGPGPVQVGACCAGHGYTSQLTLAVRRVHAGRTGRPVTSGGDGAAAIFLLGARFGGFVEFSGTLDFFGSFRVGLGLLRLAQALPYFAAGPPGFRFLRVERDRARQLVAGLFQLSLGHPAACRGETRLW